MNNPNEAQFIKEQVLRYFSSCFSNTSKFILIDLDRLAVLLAAARQKIYVHSPIREE
jgi:hypothetical protein